MAKHCSEFDVICPIESGRLIKLTTRIKKLNGLKKKAREWVKDYDSHKEHDLHLSICLKDDAYNLLRELIRF